MFSIFNKDNSDRSYAEKLSVVLDSLYNFAYRLTQNRQDAEDLTQETALRGHKNYHLFKADTNFKAWMFTMMRNIFINEYRRKMKQPTAVNFEDVEGFIALPEVSEREETLFSEALQGLIDDLSQELRATVILFYVENLSYKEMADVMKCPVGTVMSRLFTARQILKQKLLVSSKKEVSND